MGIKTSLLTLFIVRFYILLQVDGNICKCCISIIQRVIILIYSDFPSFFAYFSAYVVNKCRESPNEGVNIILFSGNKLSVNLGQANSKLVRKHFAHSSIFHSTYSKNAEHESFIIISFFPIFYSYELQIHFIFAHFWYAWMKIFSMIEFFPVPSKTNMCVTQTQNRQ